MCGVKKDIGGPNRLMMLALGGLLGPQNALQTPRKCSKYTLWAVFVAVNTSVGRTCTV